MRASFLRAHNVILEKATNDFGTTAVVAALHMQSVRFTTNIYYLFISLISYSLNYILDGSVIAKRLFVESGFQMGPHANPSVLPLVLMTREGRERKEGTEVSTLLN